MTTGPGHEPATARAASLSYVVPACNSTSTIEAALDVLGTRLADTGAEIVVVENGSTDGTTDLLSRLARDWSWPGVSLVVLQSAKGLGHAYQAGIAATTGDRIVLTADDLPFGFDDIDAAERLDPETHPVVIGSKGHRDSVVDRGPVRWALSLGFWLLRRAVLGMRTVDPQGTFVLAGAWGRALATELTEVGYLVTTELCFLAERQGVRPVEVPVRLSVNHAEHRSRITLRDVWHMGVGLLGIRRRHRAVPLRRVAAAARGAAFWSDDRAA